MKIKQKKCKGTGKAKGFGCGKMIYVRKYGLCFDKCWREFLLSDQGGSTLEKYTLRANKYLEKEEKQKEKEEFNKLKEQVKSGDVMKLADMYFSRYIRLFHSKDNYCTCYTCGAIKLIKETDCGHFIVRENKSVRYDENNCRPQCKTCNGDTKHRGKQLEFRENLTREIGEKKVIELEGLGKQQIKAGYHFYKEISNKYRIKVNELQKEMGVKIW